MVLVTQMSSAAQEHQEGDCSRPHHWPPSRLPNPSTGYSIPHDMQAPERLQETQAFVQGPLELTLGIMGNQGGLSTAFTWEQVGMFFMPPVLHTQAFSSRRKSVLRYDSWYLLHQVAILRYKHTAHPIYAPEEKLGSQSLILQDEGSSPSTVQVL